MTPNPQTSPRTAGMRSVSNTPVHSLYSVSNVGYNQQGES